MGLECGWRHARKRWSRGFEDFEKRQLRLDNWGERWILTAERCSWVFRISTDRDLKNHKMHRAWEWGQDSKNCVSLLSRVTIDRSQELINAFVPETKESACIVYGCDDIIMAMRSFMVIIYNNTAVLTRLIRYQSSVNQIKPVVFCKHLTFFFTCFCLHIIFFRTSTEERINEILFVLVGESFIPSIWNTSASAWR